MDRVVVDTDVVSFYLKNDTRFEQYAMHLDGKQLVISFQTLAELLLWQELHNWGEVRRKRTSELISRQFVIYPVDQQLCQRWAQLRSEVQRAGRVIQSADAWIAATALLIEVPLATHNGRDFSQLTDLELVHYPAN